MWDGREWEMRSEREGRGNLEQEVVERYRGRREDVGHREGKQHE